MNRRAQTDSICIVTSHKYPESVGGEETFVRQFTRFLASERIPFIVVSSSSLLVREDLSPVRLREFSIPVFGYELYSLLFSSLAALRIIKIHGARRIGVLYAVDTGYSGLATIIAGKILRLTTIIHAHCKRSEQLRRERYSYGGWRAWPYWAIEKSIDHFVLENATKVVVVSRDVESFVRDLGYRKSPLLVARSGIKLEDYKGGPPEWRQKLGIPKEAFVVGYYGRLHYTKGVHVLLAAYADFHKRSSKPTILLIAGVGPASSQLEELAQRLNLENVRFLGYLSEVKPFLRSLSVFVFPSFQEGSPIALLEAMAVGCPTIASDIAGISHIAKDCAILVPPGNSKRLADSLFELERDPVLRRDLASRSRFESSKYSIHDVLSQIFEFTLS